MKKISMVGLGVGNVEYLTTIGKKRLDSCELIIASKRQLEDIEFFGYNSNKLKCIKKITEIPVIIDNNKDKDIVLLVSGDTGFYSLLPYIKRNYPEQNIEVITGISSYQYLFAKLGEVWHDYRLISLHGRECDYIKYLKNGEKLIILTDNTNTPYSIVRGLYDEKMLDYEIIVGENLSYEDEKIEVLKPIDYEKLDRDMGINIVIIRRKEVE